MLIYVYMTNGSLASHLYSMFSSPLRCMLLVLFFIEYNEEQCIVFMNFMPTDALVFGQNHVFHVCLASPENS